MRHAVLMRQFMPPRELPHAYYGHPRIGRWWTDSPSTNWVTSQASDIRDGRTLVRITEVRAHTQTFEYSIQSAAIASIFPVLFICPNRRMLASSLRCRLKSRRAGSQGQADVPVRLPDVMRHKHHPMLSDVWCVSLGQGPPWGLLPPKNGKMLAF
ncbi:hypothetical protein DAEQUDRAFT_184709 [Daedalea quercina L-15889]|uniref:Uncharacterized protein n=1 Tax=Daedalea quercina L-15889 TaxID=1314783 RepID=A0A165KIH4_9APHY|nr:hypothetical protein DAEQUDRAFT_184709 [Daedalea quercina L-15889]